MSTEIKNRFSDQELAEFKVLIEEKIEKANEDLVIQESVDKDLEIKESTK